MSGGVQNVYAVTLVVELHNGGCYRDTSLLLYLHPVGYGVTGVLLALDRAGKGDRASVQQELFGERGFTGVRVRDYRERTAPFDFVS